MVRDLRFLEHRSNGDTHFPRTERNNPGCTGSSTALSIPRGHPDSERLKPSEWLHVTEFYQSLSYPSPYLPLPFRSHFGSHGAIGLYNIVTDLNSFQSGLFRSAVLVFMSHQKNCNPSDRSTYLAKYRREAQNCINNGSLEEVVYASYVVTIYTIIGGESVQMAIKYCRQFCKSFAELVRVRKTMDDWMELLWRESLSSLYYVHRDTVLFNYPNTPATSIMEGVEQWEKLLETSFCLLASQDDIANIPLSMKTERICHKIKSLSIYMQIYLDQFLQRVIVAENAEETNITKERLFSIVERIMRLVLHLSNISDYIYDAYEMETNAFPVNNSGENTFLHFPPVQPRGLQAAGDSSIRDTALALLYAFARLLKSMLKPTMNDKEQVLSEAHRSAIAICRLCANVEMGWARETLLVKRSLFWAGLILTESTLPSG